MENLWIELDKSDLTELKDIEDECFFARENKSEGYKRGRTNNLILNFKKSPQKKRDYRVEI